ncbi:MAG TPA: ribbon-helix-helix domain-containing protein [Pseudonocardiaceae bacterium]|nr:ribbon-helix-helix domain-containing protein [Pseudonocardiaceae bacterium]
MAAGVQRLVPVLLDDVLIGMLHDAREEFIIGAGADQPTVSGRCAPLVPRTEHDDFMKRITVSLPDELADAVKEAAGGEGSVSAYVAAALRDYQQRETLAEILASWRAETPPDEREVRDVDAELDRVCLMRPTDGDRLAG